MTIGQSCLSFLVSFLASTVGAVCGIGGGIIIKPTLDLLGWANVSTISFLSSCTVLSMSFYTVGHSILAGDSRVKLKTGTPLAVGAAIGGAVGNHLFTAVKNAFANPNTVGAVQAGCLAVVTLGTLLYTLRKDQIRTHKTTNIAACLAIGLILGICSSFLGIGGGPINLVVLYYFFSMSTKTAAANSLYIILFSQFTSLTITLFSGNIPEFHWGALALMVLGGILGGIVGRSANRLLRTATVERLFLGLMVLIIGICLYNFWQYAY